MTRRSLALAAVLLSLTLTGCGPEEPGAPLCDPQLEIMALFAQSVPSATELPCVTQMPAGWSFADQTVQSGRATFWLDSAIAGYRAIQVSLQRRCDASGAVLVPSTAEDELGLRRFERPEQLSPLRLVRFYRFPGGCVIYRFTFSSGAPSDLTFQADEAVSFLPRERVVGAVADQGFELCGAGVACES